MNAWYQECSKAERHILAIEKLDPASIESVVGARRLGLRLASVATEFWLAPPPALYKRSAVRCWGKEWS